MTVATQAQLHRLSNCWSSLSRSVSPDLLDFSSSSPPLDPPEARWGSKIFFSYFFCRLIITDTRWSVLPKSPDDWECKDQSWVVSFLQAAPSNSQHQCQSSLTRETGNRSGFLILHTQSIKTEHHNRHQGSLSISPCKVAVCCSFILWRGDFLVCLYCGLWEPPHPTPVQCAVSSVSHHHQSPPCESPVVTFI